MSATIQATNLEEYRKAGGKPDSAKNQEICRKLVDREVHHCLSSLVDHFAKHPEALEGSGHDYDEIMDLCQRRIDNSQEIEELEEAIADLEDDITDMEDAEGDTTAIKARLKKAEEDKQQLESEQDEPCEVYEHWAVSKWFAERLKEQGETVGELFDFTVWGRTTTGQSICIDHVIQQVAAQMEILEGQRNAW